MTAPKIFSDLSHEKLEEMGYKKESYEVERVFTSIYDEIVYIIKNQIKEGTGLFRDNICVANGGKSNYLYLKDLANNIEMPSRFTLLASHLNAAIGHNNRKWEALDGNFNASLLFKLNFEFK